MPQSAPNFFEFDGVRLYPGTASLVRIRDKATFTIRPKALKLLLTLLDRPGETVTYREIWVAVWPEMKDFNSVRPRMRETKSTLDKLLRDILKSADPIIQTITSQGYCLKADVTKPSNSDAAKSDQHEPPTTSSLFAVYPWHVLGSCAIYSSAYVCVLLLEVSYKSDHSHYEALLLSPLVFLWIFGTSIVALITDWKLTLKERSIGLPLLILSFIGASLILYGALSFFLPKTPVTEATFQTQTAQGAYLKNIAFYFLPLAMLFLLIPFHFVAALKSQIAANKSASVLDCLLNKRRSSAPGNAIYIKPGTLGSLLFIAGIICLPLTYQLLESLKPGPYLNLFTQLVMLRLILYFGLGGECLFWYSRTLNEIKHNLLQA